MARTREYFVGRESGLHYKTCRKPGWEASGDDLLMPASPDGATPL
jgi:hypothetical protein